MRKQTKVYVEKFSRAGVSAWDIQIDTGPWFLYLDLDYPTKRQAMAHAKRLREALKREA